MRMIEALGLGIVLALLLAILFAAPALLMAIL